MRFITIDNNNIITSIRWGNEILQGEIQSEYGELGQKYNPLDNSFENVKAEEPASIDTGLSTEDKIDYIFYTLKGGIENV